MSVSVTTSDIDIVAVNIRPKSKDSYDYTGDFVLRSGSSRSTVAFSFSASTVSGSYSAFGRSFNYYVQGAKEDWEQRRASATVTKKTRVKTKKKTSSEFKKRYIFYILVVFLLYVFRNEIYENEELIINAIIELLKIILEVIKIVVISIYEFLMSFFRK